MDTERNIEIKNNPVDIFGVNEKYINLIKELNKNIKIIARGNTLKVKGKREDVNDFEDKFNILLLGFERFGKITEQDINQIFENTDHVHLTETENKDYILIGNHGKFIKARTANQYRMVSSIQDNDLLFAIGPAGTGKTYTAVALAVRALKNKEVKRIILTRPAVEAGENLGFLPGDMRDKLDPYLQPLYGALRDMIHPKKLISYLEEGIIEIVPLAYMRGRTLDNAFVILDEAQNTTPVQIKMFLTRMGISAKFIVTGDMTQIDLPRKQKSGLTHASHILKNIKNIDFVYLSTEDIVRHQLVKHIIDAYEKNDKTNV